MLTEREKEKMAERKAFHEEKQKKRLQRHAEVMRKKHKANITKRKRRREKIVKELQREEAILREVEEKKDAASLIKQELASRILSQRNLLPFVQRTFPNYQAGWVHKDICWHLDGFLEKVVDKEAPRKMFFMPPRTGKSELITKRFPAFALGKYPELGIISTSYAASLAESFSRLVQVLVRSEEYHTIFPGTNVYKHQERVDHWLVADEKDRLTGGEYIAAGVGGGITGKGGNIILCDDPVKNREEADSLIVQEKNWAWWGSTARTRLAPGGGIIVVQTRWSFDDLSGKIEQQMREDPEAEEYEIISYPALAEDDEYMDLPTHEIIRKPRDPTAANLKLLRIEGEALHPERYDETELNRIRHTLSPRDWSALYQQSPIPSDGGFVKEDYYHFYRPENHQFDSYRNIMSADLAIGIKRSNDASVFAVGSIGFDGRLYVRDCIRGRFSNFEKADRIFELHKNYKFYIIGLEQGAIALALEEVLRKQMKERRDYIRMDDSMKPIMDKEVRAGPLQAAMQAGDVLFPESKPKWFLEARDEMLRFGPQSNKDDYVDALAWLFHLAMRVSPPKAKLSRRQKKESLEHKLKEHLRGQKNTTYMSS